MIIFGITQSLRSSNQLAGMHLMTMWNILDGEFARVRQIPGGQDNITEVCCLGVSHGYIPYDSRFRHLDFLK